MNIMFALSGNPLLIFVLLYLHPTSASTHLDRSPLVSYTIPLHSENSTSTPLFYGWFLNESVAESVSIIGKKYFLSCYDHIPQFQVFVDDLLHKNNLTNPLEYYVKPLDPDSQLPDLHYHTTAKFCGRNDSVLEESCASYLQEIAQFLGRPYRIHFVGLFFTSKTFGLRVKLTSEEQTLFREDGRQNSAQVAAPGEDEVDNHIARIAPEETQVFSYEPLFKRTPLLEEDPDNSTHPYYPGVKFRPQEANFHPTESRAHVTLGCAPKVEAVQTGLDLLEIVDLEVSSYAYHQDYSVGGEDIPKATLRQFKVVDGVGSTRAFVLYPEDEMIAEAVFDAYL